ncbi:MAG: transglycosylase SLT domain-containing protein [Nitrospirae bacterium]|nr:transglycosylase SLT domain-containing protein [Nitrospirota bacterium]
MIKKLLIILIVIFFTSGNCLALDKIYNHLRIGKNGLETCDYKRAVEEFDKYLKEAEILQDYALFWRAKAYKELGQTEEALKDIKTIKTIYPSSPIVPFALRFEIEIQTDISKSKTVELCKEYINKFPSKSSDIRLLYAETLKNMGNTEEAKKQYKQLYLKGKPLPKNIMKLYGFQKLGAGSQMTRAESLIKEFKYCEAEALMMANVNRATGENLRKEYFLLAHSLFLQKKYKNAADYFQEAGDIYHETFSLYRADYDRYKKRINHNIETLEQNGSPKADDLLLKIGQQAKNDGDFDGAIKILLSIKKNSTNDEEVTWYTGWTYFLKGDYDKSFEIFNSLQEKYPNPKYLFWMGRSLENQGKDPMPVYKKITAENNYYTLLSQYRNKTIPPINDLPASSKDEPISKELQRLNILIILKLDPAISIEAGHILKTLGKENDSLIGEAASLLDSTGLHYKAVSLTDRITYREELHKVFYPLVFKDSVDFASNSFAISQNLIYAIMREESRYNETAYSPAGAVGLMQLMPNTAVKIAQKCGIEIKDNDEIIMVNTNINLGAKYLKILVDEFNSLPPAIASYNAGRLIVKTWLSRGNYKSADEFIEDIPYVETRNYVKRVLRSYFQYLRYNVNNYDDPQWLLTLKSVKKIDQPIPAK